MYFHYKTHDSRPNHTAIQNMRFYQGYHYKTHDSRPEHTAIQNMRFYQG